MESLGAGMATADLLFSDPVIISVTFLAADKPARRSEVVFELRVVEASATEFGLEFETDPP